MLERALAAVVIVASIGCGDEPVDGDGGACLEPLPADCEPAYPPTFRNLFDNELGTTCGSRTTGGSCHSAEGAQAGLVLETFDGAYDHLLGLGDSDGRERVLPGDPDCSLLMQRLRSDQASFRMPPAAMPLHERELCAFDRWIANGAEK